MILDYCRNCKGNNTEHFKGKQYKFDEDDVIIVIDGFICKECGCLHVTKNGNLLSWEWTHNPDHREVVDAVANWATKH